MQIRHRYTQSDQSQLPESLVFQEDPEKVVIEKLVDQRKEWVLQNIMKDILSKPEQK